MITKTKLENKELIFIFPYKGIGGVSTLFMNMAEIISREYDTKVSVVDYKNGYISKNIDLNPNLQLLTYSEKENLKLPSNSIAIFQSMTPWSIFPNLSFGDETKFFYWNLHPMNLIPMLPGFRWLTEKHPTLGRLISKSLLFSYRSRILKLLSYLENKQSICFMDITNLETTQAYLDYEIKDPKFLPIGIMGSIDPPFKYEIDSSVFRSGWLGRSTGFKNTILIRVLRDLDKVAKNSIKDFVFYLISDSVDINLNPYKNLNFEFIDPISPKELDTMLEYKMNVMFAMGTSAFEAAARGIPTVLLDFSYKRIPPTYLYKMIFEADSYSAGNFLEVSKVIDGKTMKEIVSLTSDDFDQMSNLSREFILSNHNVPNLCENFLEVITNSKSDIDEMKELGLLRTDLLYDVLNKFR